jgi:hypothetical protein
MGSPAGSDYRFLLAKDEQIKAGMMGFKLCGQHLV